MMAWMPVAEAAATLGLSERTVWRRIKSETIPSRSDNGRTLVSLETRDPDGDPVWQLSNVAAAQLSMRKLDADTVSDVLAIAADYRKSFEAEIARARRSSRWTGLAAVVLVAILFAGGWRFLDTLQRTRLEQQAALADLRQEFQENTVGLKTKSAQATGLAAARHEEIENLRQRETQSHEHLLAVEAARGALRTTLDQRLGALQKSLATGQEAVKQRDQRIANLTQNVQTLQAQLADAERAREAVLRQTERVTAAIRRSAARSAGTAAGLRLSLDRQHREIGALRRQTAGVQGDGTHHEQPPANETVTRQALWNTVLHRADSAATSASASPPTWRDTLLTWIRPWMPVVPARTPSAPSKELVAASSAP